MLQKSQNSLGVFFCFGSQFYVSQVFRFNFVYNEFIKESNRMHDFWIT